MDSELPDPSQGPCLIRVKRMLDGKRIDQYLVDRFPDYSRSLIQKAIAAGSITVNNAPVKRSYLIKKGDQIEVELPVLPDTTPIAQQIPIEIVYEDEFFVVIDKPPGMVVHPGKGNYTGTLVNAIQYHFDNLSQVAGELRPGIVHRLDRDTSGLIVVAKDDLAHSALAFQFENRTVRKEYLAITSGVVERDSDFIEKPLGPHPTHREKMAIRSIADGGKAASSYYEVIERFRDYSFVRVEPKTGRTHQIRVHLAHIGCPVLADPMYGGRKSVRVGELDPTLKSDTVVLERHALHAHRLWIDHPRIRQPMEFESKLPADMHKALSLLRGRQ